MDIDWFEPIRFFKAQGKLLTACEFGPNFRAKHQDILFLSLFNVTEQLYGSKYASYLFKKELIFKLNFALNFTILENDQVQPIAVVKNCKLSEVVGYNTSRVIWGYPKQVGSERHTIPMPACMVLHPELDCKVSKNIHTKVITGFVLNKINWQQLLNYKWYFSRIESVQSRYGAADDKTKYCHGYSCCSIA